MKKSMLLPLTASLLLGAIGLLGTEGTSLAHAQEVSFSGNLETVWGAYAPGTENAGNLSVGKTDFTGSLEAYSGNGTAFLEANADYDFTDNQLKLDLSEAYVDYSSSFCGFRIGQQKIAWGKADGISITNTVFPSDATSLFSDDSSLAVKSARLSITGNAFTVDAMLIPFFTGTALPLEENNPLRKALVPETVTVSQGGSSMELPVNVGTLATPEMNLKNMEYALKASGYFSFCDVSLYGFYGWDKTPVLSYQVNTTLHPVYGVEVPESLTINGEYKKLAMIGMDFAVPVGPVVLRTETAFFPNREFQSSAETMMAGKENSIKQHQLMALAGVDWMPSGWTVTAQYYCDILLNKSEDVERENAFEHGATISVSKTLLNDTLDLSLSALVGLNSFDSAITGSVEYKLTDEIALSLGTYVFLPGKEKGTYGNYSDLSSVFIKAKYRW